MITEKIVELLLLQFIFTDYKAEKEYRYYLENNYDVDKLQERYLALGKEYLQQYALNKTEKSEENL